ncbi:hypothetical protein [Streptacidiphilus carbonis]|uniref:hypothetical protein n=1 Tax=Streptacidiphilus carbonis TaxID=105422 RepID=UPI0005AAC076|nr:hypothetical protein [Streptacidiphilus carbonis]
MRARYHLRFQIHPDPDPARVAADATELAKACAQAQVDEVVLLTGAEESFAGHLTDAEESVWFETARLAKDTLEAAGLEVSLNPWVTVGHADRGRNGALERLGFAPMVSPDGQASTAQASFACPRWRAWIVAHYGRFAELGFRVLWLEDDFRYHNHAPLHWGGGFEPLMLERFTALTGWNVTPQELTEALTAPGRPHPWRILLQQVWREAQLEVVAAVATEVEQRSRGRSRLGLMSSGLDAASVEGRDWPALFGALAIGGRAAQRPHFAPYTDTPGRELSRQIWSLELQRALRPDFVDSEPEIENWPHTAWSKSDTQTWSEMAAAQLAGSDALLLNVHPMHGRRAARFPRVTELLARSRPALDWLAARYHRDQSTIGVGLPFAQDAAAHVRTRSGGAPALAELAVDPGPVADLLLRYGVPVTADPRAPVQALFGQSAWALADEELHRLLGGGLLLDGTAAAILVQRGFGPLLGLDDVELVRREQPDPRGPYAEEYVPGTGAVLSVNMQPTLARLAPGPDTETWTEIRTPQGLRWGAGRTAFRNRLGGRVAVLAATDPSQLPYDDSGQHLLHRAVRFLEGDRPRLPLVTGGPHLIPHASRRDGTTRLAIANGSADSVRPHIAMPAAPTDPHATLLRPLAEPASAGTSAQPDGLQLEADLPHRGWLVLEW